MRLDVIIPTYNRSQLLRRALESLFRARLSPQLDVGITVVDNNSSDPTRHVVETSTNAWSGELQYLFEPRQGKSFALNRGIASTSGELVGFIDDDEEVDPGWFVSVYDAFRSGDVDFIGGPCKRRFEHAPPSWLPRRWVSLFAGPDLGETEMTYDESCPGILPGGNAVISRQILNKVGGYSTRLGPTKDARLMGCEDDDMYRRLLRAGARGRYIPDLAIHHYIPTERLNKRYLRRVVFWRAASLGVLDYQNPESVRRFLGVPLYRYRKVLSSLNALIYPFASTADRFSAELEVRHFFGFFWGRHVCAVS